MIAVPKQNPVFSPTDKDLFVMEIFLSDAIINHSKRKRCILQKWFGQDRIGQNAEQ